MEPGHCLAITLPYTWYLNNLRPDTEKVINTPQVKYSELYDVQKSMISDNGRTEIYVLDVGVAWWILKSLWPTLNPKPTMLNFQFNVICETIIKLLLLLWIFYISCDALYCFVMFTGQLCIPRISGRWVCSIHFQNRSMKLLTSGRGKWPNHPDPNISHPLPVTNQTSSLQICSVTDKTWHTHTHTHTHKHIHKQLFVNR